MLYIAFSAILIATLGFAFVVYRLVRFPSAHLGQNMPVDELGKVEGNIQGLRRVIVIADHVEDPERELRKAVQENFRRGVCYLFLISQRTAKAEVAGYYKIFETLAEIIIAKHQLPHELCDLISIQQLPYDWPDYPYVFYETVTQASGEESQFTAFRGNQRKEGIADYYSIVAPHYAHTIARAVLSEAPQPIVVSVDQFPADSKVIPIDGGRSRETAAA